MSQFKKQVVVSTSNFFLIQRGAEMIRLRKGMTKEQVKDLLGEPLSINEGNNPKNLKFIFKMKGNSSQSENYELLFRENFLEWSIKTKNR